MENFPRVLGSCPFARPRRIDTGRGRGIYFFFLVFSRRPRLSMAKKVPIFLGPLPVQWPYDQVLLIWLGERGACPVR